MLNHVVDSDRQYSESDHFGSQVLDEYIYKHFTYPINIKVKFEIVSCSVYLCGLKSLQMLVDTEVVYSMLRQSLVQGTQNFTELSCPQNVRSSQSPIYIILVNTTPLRVQVDLNCCFN